MVPTFTLSMHPGPYTLAAWACLTMGGVALGGLFLLPAHLVGLLGVLVVSFLSLCAAALWAFRMEGGKPSMQALSYLGGVVGLSLALGFAYVLVELSGK